MAIEIVDFPIKKWWIFPVRYVSVYQRVSYHMTPQNPTGPGPPMVKIRPWICCWWILWVSPRSRVTGGSKTNHVFSRCEQNGWLHTLILVG